MKIYKSNLQSLSWHLIENDFTRVETDTDDTKRFYNDKNQYHRLSGPAIEYSTGGKSWYVNGYLIGRSIDRFSDEKFEEWKKLMKLSWQEIEEPRSEEHTSELQSPKD